MMAKYLILTGFGINCEQECCSTLKLAGAKDPEIVHISQLIAGDIKLKDYQFIVFPGGFLDGDDLGSAKVQVNRFRFAKLKDAKKRLADELFEFIEAGNLALGICNGFQFMTKAGLLPGNPGSQFTVHGSQTKNTKTKTAEDSIQCSVPESRFPGHKAQCPVSGSHLTSPQQKTTKSGSAVSPIHRFTDSPFTQSATLTFNDSGKFEDRWTYLTVNPDSPCIFTKGVDRMYLPVRHGEGKFFCDTTTLDAIMKGNLHVLQYADETFTPTMRYPYNPNGAFNSIAGICDRTGRLFGLMPHPEAFAFTVNHPRWTRETVAEPDGLKIFINAVQYLR